MERKTFTLSHYSFTISLSHSLRWLFLSSSVDFHLYSFSLNFILFNLLAWRRDFNSAFLFIFILISFSINDLCECMYYACVQFSQKMWKTFDMASSRVHRHTLSLRLVKRKKKCAHSVCHGKLNWSEYKSAANRQKTPEENAANCLRLSISHSHSAIGLFAIASIAISANGMEWKLQKKWGEKRTMDDVAACCAYLLLSALALNIRHFRFSAVCACLKACLSGWIWSVLCVPPSRTVYAPLNNQTSAEWEA